MEEESGDGESGDEFPDPDSAAGLGVPSIGL